MLITTCRCQSGSAQLFFRKALLPFFFSEKDNCTAALKKFCPKSAVCLQLTSDATRPLCKCRHGFKTEASAPKFCEDPNNCRMCHGMMDRNLMSTVRIQKARRPTFNVTGFSLKLSEHRRCIFPKVGIFFELQFFKIRL